MSNVYCLECRGMIVTANKVDDSEFIECPFCGHRDITMGIYKTHVVMGHMMFEGEFVL